MPHDLNGNILVEGDTVSIPCRVLTVHAGEEFCNLDLLTIYPMPPFTEGTRWGQINTKQVVKTPSEPAKVAYEAYRSHTGGVSLASGHPIPEWEALRPDIQEAWGAAAKALVGA